MLEVGLSFVAAVRLCFRRYATFRGRSGRSEFWWWVVFALLADLVLVELLKMAGGDWIAVALSWASMLPTLAVTTRRLHDVGRRGWWQIGLFLPGLLLMVIPVLAFSGVFILAGDLFLLIYWLADPSEQGSNAYGPPPGTLPSA